MHRSYGLQGSLKRRYKHPSPTSINGYHTAKKLLSQSPAKRPTFAFADESGYTHSPLPTGSHTAAYTPKQGLFRMGRYYYPRSVSHVSETLRGQVSERQTLPLLRLDPVCSRRTQRAFGTAMRLCASLFRGAAAPLGCVIFSVSVEIYGFTPRTQGFLCVRGGGGITTPGVRCVLPKFSAPACQSSLFAVF